MRIVVTGADGFLGGTLQHAFEHAPTTPWSPSDDTAGRGSLRPWRADAVLHLAGVNRGTERDVMEANVELADDVGDAIRRSRRQPALVFANSVRAGEDSAYGAGKRAAAQALSRAAADAGARFVDVALPNLFGEHGRPDYNSFVATFVAAVARGSSRRLRPRD
jgi:UDP-2-acetamido-2,6-beta-L-arabino-hexul-4-ose reductase